MSDFVKKWSLGHLEMPRLAQTSKQMAALDHLMWSGGFGFVAYGQKLGIRVDDSSILERLLPYLPPGWKPMSEPVVKWLYSLWVDGSGNSGTHQPYQLYLGADRLAQTSNLTEALNILESDLQLLVATHSTQGLFIHAGVVGWQGKAILIPGRSFAGKTTLVMEMVKAGATYYSDEYAIVDEQGWVWPYPRWLSMRGTNGQGSRRCSPQELGVAIGVEPLPVGLIIVTKYQADAQWQAQTLTPGEAMLALLDNTVAARTQPEVAMARLQKIVLKAKTIKSNRNEAKTVISQLLF